MCQCNRCGNCGSEGGREIPPISQDPKVILVEPRFVVCGLRAPLSGQYSPPCSAFSRKKPGHSSSAYFLPHSFGAHVQSEMRKAWVEESLKQVSLHMIHSCPGMLYQQELPIQLSLGNSVNAVFPLKASGRLSFTLLSQFASKVQWFR